ncbi:OsmC family protein [Arthrobacter sp. AL08]|uniref:OsmC family protein n=1 Tax=unclassified Arthrobacter TaxID=235627 RepID=UPI00249A9BBB|nr:MULTISPECIES: OsmC family protein [unclassified Arthrobacter]MDI3243426.1 OsmC family protein [Arthrobacter sp. AL05]MDI3279422.1 OsmC family protein [Arthrobacter sp. AL08]
MTTHTYASTLRWAGRTHDYDSYSRQHDITMSGTKVVASADSSFRGDSTLPNPEQLVVAAASSCQLLSFLAVAALAGVEVIEYHDAAKGFMPDDERPLRLTSIVLRPRIVVQGATVERVERLLHKAHKQCYIANSLITKVTLEADIEVR